MKQYNTAFPYFEESQINPILNEIKEILIGNEMLTMGRQVKTFEAEFAKYCGTKYGVATNSCTAALEIALKVFDFSLESEVIVPAQSFFASASCILRNGLHPVFCDTNTNFLLDFEDLKRKITKKTQAVIIVHFAGLIHENIFEIKEYLQQRNIKLIEDCAHAHGAYILDSYKTKHFAGSIGDIGCYSFFSTKIMTTGEGGMLLCSDDKLYNKAASIRNRGIDCTRSGENFVYVGTNSRFTELQAILGLSQLNSLETFTNHRNAIASIYTKKLQNIAKFQTVPKGSRHAYWRFLAYLNNGNSKDIIQKLKEHGINADAPYRPLLHKQEIFKKSIPLPLVEELSDKHISLPIHMKITEDDAHFIAQKLLDILA